MSRSRRWTPLVAAATALAACTASLGDGGGGGVIPEVNRYTELANSLEDAAESEIPTFTLTTPGLPPSFPVLAGCPTVSNTGDGDGDEVLDDATYTFTNPPCVASGFSGGTWSVTGSVRVQDSSQATAGSYTLTLNDLTLTFVDDTAALSYTAERNGKRSRAGDADSVTLAVTDTVRRTRPQITAVATIAKDLVWNFTPDVAGTIQVNQALPSGAVTVAGTLHWKRSTEDWTLTVATVTPLEYDASCTTTPRRIVSGRVTMTGVISGVNGVLRIDWNGCGNLPTRTFIPS